MTTKKPPYEGCVWCEAHNVYHGPLYMCDAYTDELKREIAAKQQTWKRNLEDPEWVRVQIKNGTPREVLVLCGAIIPDD